MEPPINNPEVTSPNGENPLETKRSSLLNLFIIFVLVVLVVWSGVMFWQNRSLKAEEADLAATVQRLDSQVGESESKATLATKKEFLATKAAERVYWTNVLKRLFETNPQSAEVDKRLVTYQALSGSREGNISISVKTRSGAADPYTDTAVLLREFGRRAFYKDLFIPNISSVFDQVGQELLTYTLNLKYAVTEDPVNTLIEKNELTGAVTTPDPNIDTTLDEQITDVARQLRSRDVPLTPANEQ